MAVFRTISTETRLGRSTMPLPLTCLRGRAYKFLSVQRFEPSQQLVRRGGYVADASAGCVMDGIDDRGAGSADSKLADALAAQWTAVRIGLVQKHDVQRADVGVHRDMIARQILVDEGSVARVDVVLLDQRRSDAPRHAADHLRARRFYIENAAGREHAEHASNPHLAGV